jgi:heme/copper-type cytochrome/quinol oxidase subunit 2
MGLFFKSQAIQPQVAAAIKDAYLASPPSTDEEAKTLATAKAASVSSDTKTLAPRWAVFIVAVVLIVILLLLTIQVATAADAQPATVTSSQLKTLSSSLITAFTTLIGAIVGVITGEAVSTKT